ncbi:DUF6279 family lipoprotein [Alteromonas oceanisediminis]|uniref:DUF6279 family lipoprotein n=1 Tax=Alteromonas oceanisediminis TaxID=2836180 RepID=UPI001BDB123A|nr:DUF6279 family lipoprotein [Alteromonas oceanisediminis]MBT0587188.1 hypothetical protein [Alteromonas oceanisediminis]
MRKLLMLVLAVMAIAGCSSKLAYNNLDWLVYWYIDDYIEFTDAQEQRFDQKLGVWLTWHRGDELGRYVEHLKVVKQKVNQPELTAAEIELELDRGRAHWERLRDRLSPEIAALAPDLSEEQVIYLFAELEAENAEREEEREEKFGGKTPAEQVDMRAEELSEEVEDLIGTLNDQQQAIIQATAPQLQSTYELWMEYRRNIQNEARRLFALRDQSSNFVAQLTALMTNPDVYRSAEYVALSEQNRSHFVNMIAELHGTLTDKQKRKLNKQIDDIIEDLTDLMSDT